jgi:hypothetical protein
MLELVKPGELERLDAAVQRARAFTLFFKSNAL